MTLWNFVRLGALSFGVLLGAFMALMMALDAYPFVPSEGFSLSRKVQDVLAVTAWGAVVGAGLGALGYVIAKVVIAVRSLLLRRYHS